MSKNIDPPAPNTEKWTEITLLPEWEEEYYLVYTAKKHGKWVMLKTLKPEFADKPEFQAMIEKEFDVRYNLSHPSIVMINDFEDVPGLGRCIITDDVYGDSLRKLINEGKVTPAIIDKLRHELVDAMEYIQTNHIVHHPIRPETIIFTENIGYSFAVLCALALPAVSVWKFANVRARKRFFMPLRASAVSTRFLRLSSSCCRRCSSASSASHFAFACSHSHRSGTSDHRSTSHSYAPLCRCRMIPM